MSILSFRSLKTGQASDAWSPIVDSLRHFAPQWVVNAGAEGVMRPFFPLFAMYMPHLLDDGHELWKQLDDGIAAGHFRPGADRLLIDCSWESWEFDPGEFELVHAKLQRRGIPLDTVVLVQMCLNMPGFYRAWMSEAYPKSARMKLHAYWGAASVTGLHINASLGDDAAFAIRNMNLVKEFYGRARRPKRFLCFNNMTKPWRTSTALLLWENAREVTSFSHGRISPEEVPYQASILSPWFADPSNLEARLAAFAANTPYVLDLETGAVEARDRATFGFDHSLYDTTSISLVTESEMSSRGNLRITEKTYKPLAMGHPFVLFGNHRALSVLRAQGFRTFEPFIDESYDAIASGPERIHAAHAVALRLARMSDAEFADGMRSVADATLHNAMHFRRGFNDLQWIWLTDLAHAIQEEFAD